MVETLSPPLATPFVRQLVAQLRAQDAHGVWDGKSDETLLAPYILDAEARRALPLFADPDPDTLWRLEMFYNAVSMAVERATGIVATPLTKFHHEGFGRVVLTAGHLVVLSKHLRDVHRFGFASLEKLSAEGGKLVEWAVQMIGKYPDLARGE